MSRFRRFLLRLGVILGVAAVAPLLLLAAANTRPGLATIETVLNRALDGQARLTGLSGRLPDRLSVRQVELLDPAGVWLLADDVRLDWSPRGLLRGRLEIDDLGAARIAVARQPVARQPAPDAAPFDPAALLPPLDVRIEDLSAPMIVLAPELLGPDTIAGAELSFSAALAIPRDGRAIAIEATLRRQDAPASADILLTHDAVANRLTLDITAEEPAGGLLARLLRLPGLPAVRLRANGDGPLDDLTLTFDAAAGDIATAQARLSLTQAAGGLRATLAGDADIAAALPHVYRPLAGPRIGFAATVARQGDGPMVIESAGIETGSARADASGRVDLDTNMGSGQIEATGDLAPLSGLAGMPLGGELRLDASVGFGVARGVDLRGSAAVAGLSLDGAPPVIVGGEPAVVYDIAIDAAGDVLVRALTATAGPLTATAAGRIAADGGLDMTLSAEAGDIAALGIQGLPGLRGRASATARLDGAIDGEIAMALRGDVSGFASGVAAVDALAGDRLGYRADARYGGGGDGGGDGGVRIETFAIDAGQVRLTGDAGLDRSLAKLTAAVDVAIADLAPLSAPLGAPIAGGVAGQVRLTGDPADPAITASARWRDAGIGDIAQANVSAEVGLRNLVSTPAGDIRLALGWRDFAVDIDSRLALDGDVLTLAGLTLRGAGVSADADLRIDTARGLIRGPVNGGVGDLAVFSALAGRDLGGGGDVTATFAVDAGVQTLTAAFTAAALRVDAVTIDGAQGSATLRAPFGAPAGELQAVAWGVDSGGLRLVDVGLGAALRANALDFNLRVTGPERIDTEVTVGGAIGWRDAIVELVLDRIDGRLAGETLNLARPARLARDDVAMTLNDLDLAIGAGRLHGGLELGARRVSGDIALDALPVGPLAALTGGPAVDGVASAQLRLAGTPTAPDVSLTLRLADLAAPGQALAADVPPVDVTARADWRDEQVTFAAAVEGVDGLQANLDGVAPLRGDLTTYQFTVPDTAPLRARLTVDGDINALSRLAPLDGHLLRGQLAGNIAVDGTLAQLTVSGDGGLTDGFYAHAASGFVLRNIRLRLAGDDRRLLVQDLAADDGDGGGLDGGGAISFGDGGGIGTVDVALNMTALNIARIDEVHARASGALRLAGRFDDMLLSGAVRVDEADIEIPRSLPVSVTTIEVTEINLPSERRTPTPRETNGGAADTDTDTGTGTGTGVVRLDVAVDLPGRVFVRGRGLDSEWRGAFQVGGRLTRPVVDGELEIVRGRFDLAGKSFDFQRGQIDVTTSQRGNIEAMLDLLAAAQAGDITAEVQIDGPVLSPDITLQSTPSLPQDEILARVLFGKNVGSLNAVQAFQLAQSALVLSGRLGSGGVVSDIRRSLGLDALDVEGGDGDGVGGATLKAGKYIADDVYLGMRQGLTPQSSRAILEYKVLPWLSLESSVGATADSDIGVTLERRY